MTPYIFQIFLITWEALKKSEEKRIPSGLICKNCWMLRPVKSVVAKRKQKDNGLYPFIVIRTIVSKPMLCKMYYTWLQHLIFLLSFGIFRGLFKGLSFFFSLFTVSMTLRNYIYYVVNILEASEIFLIYFSRYLIKPLKSWQDINGDIVYKNRKC